MNLPSVRALARRSDSSALPGLALLLLASSVPLAAQTPAPAANEEPVVLSPFTISAEQSEGYHAGEAVSAVRVRAALIDTPSSISVITRDMIDDLAPTRIFDVTRYVAGVQEGRGIQFQDRMIIRGFETQGGARTVDNFLQSADADNVEEIVIDRIEITKGPNAILSPAGAPGGSVNIITKSPSFAARRSFSAQFGLFNSQKATLDMTGPLTLFGNGKDFAYRLIGSLQDTRQYWSSDARTRNKSLSPMLTWRISDQTQLTTKLVAAEHWIFREPATILDPNTTSSTSDPRLAPGFSYNGLNGIQPWSHVETHTADLFSVLTHSFNEHNSLRVAANARYYFTDSDQEFVNGLPGFGSRYNPATGELTQDYTWAIVNGTPVSTFSPLFNPAAIPVRGQIQWTRAKTGNLQADELFKHNFGQVDSQTVIGAAYSRQYGYSRVKDPGPLPSINLSAFPGYTVPTYPINLTGHNGNSYTNTQAYISQRFGFFENKLYLTGGYLHYSTKTKAWNILTGAAPSILDDSKNLWNISALYKVTDSFSLYVSKSINAAPTIANGQPLWKSGEQTEYGFKAEFMDHKLSLNGAYFEIAQTNNTVPNPARQNDPTAPEQLVQDLSNKGYELELTGALTKELSIVGTYAHLKMRDSLGRMIRMVADDNASALLNYRFDQGEAKGLSVYLGVNYSGKRAGDVPAVAFMPAPFQTITAKVSFYLKPQYVNTLGATYRLNERYTLRLNVDNIFDKKDYIQVGGARFWGAGTMTATGRNIRFTTTVNF